MEVGLSINRHPTAAFDLITTDVCFSSEPADEGLLVPPVTPCLEPQPRLLFPPANNSLITRGIESLFGTRDESLRVLEKGVSVTASLMNDSLEIEGLENLERAVSFIRI